LEELKIHIKAIDKAEVFKLLRKLLRKIQTCPGKKTDWFASNTGNYHYYFKVEEKRND